VNPVSDTGLWMVVPVRSLRDGKSRLAPVLNIAQRTALVESLLARTLEQAAEFPGLSRTLVVTGCREVGALVSKLGIRVLEESGTAGLNSALRQAQAAVVGLAGSRMLVVSCDLPLVQAHDLRQLASAASDGVLALAPDRTGRGTNAMCLPAQRAFDFAFGPDSFYRHSEHARILNLESVPVRSLGLVFDLDLPIDLCELHRLSAFCDHTSTHGSVRSDGHG
jgi:2-phospho-L-lactate/phosphoenolpyruvate guanylyltransferase